ncbi:hypothetical protein [Jeongeupia sp. USM3]|uniref:hypothetical protein n=1 Tax=Jeongeupia sp. USM3 TaxID=1906741 RepID=UPI00089DEF3B|nr:hypothetical protein [Jeongeupia sp. USM3]AOY00004.1 hypothetical protein BJP62_05785 [Jeongeupia sp. USM3]
MHLSRWIALPVLAVLPLLASCASPAYTLGQPVTAEGKLVLKGNEPFAVPVLLGQSEQWELTGLKQQQYVPLQNKAVRVRGTVARLPGEGLLRAQLQVTEIKGLPESK